MVGNDTEVFVVEIRGDKVRLGFVAPEEVPVHRKEIWLAIQKASEQEGEVASA